MTSSPVSDISVKSGAGRPSSTTATSKRRAVGVVRVSRVGDRDGERFVSPKEQAERIASVAARDSLKLVETIEELDVSGGTPLAKRDGLRRAIEMVETGRADVLVVAYFDRLVRSLAVQAEIVERVERAGGAILAVDVGEVRADTASRWLSSTMLGLVAEYHRRQTSERTADAKRRAVMRGVPPFPNVPPGLRQREDGSLEQDPKLAPVVREAFELRAGGATVMEVRSFLAEHGIVRSFHGVQAMLRSRIYLGELRFGEIVNTAAVEPLVDEVTWRRVQRMIVSRGRRAKSDRLLARLGVLRCASCGGRMAVGTQTSRGRSYPFYRCSPIGDCTARVTVSADLVEGVVLNEAVRRWAELEVEGSASATDNATAARATLERVDADIEAAVMAFSGVENVPAVQRKLALLNEEREAALDEIERSRFTPLVSVAAGDIENLTLIEKRVLIQTMTPRVLVGPGRGAARIRFEPFPEQPPSHLI